MPKRGGQRHNYNSSGGGGGGNGSRFSSLKDYQHDDDRIKERNTTRRVSFKPLQSQYKSGVKLRLAESAIRSRLEEDDEMGDLATSSFNNFEERNAAGFTRRKGSPIPRGKFGNLRKLVPSTFGWYQITINNGQQYGKDDVIRALLNAMAPDIFIPHYWRTEKSCIVFFVDDYNVAERLEQIGRKAQMSDGFRLYPRVRSGCPLVAVDAEFKEKMKQVMAKRYNAQRCALDLSKFHADPDFKNMFCALFRQPVMATALDIIEQNIPDLVALNLNDNSLHTMEAFKCVEKRLPNLKILYLGDNKIPSLAHLLVFRNVPITELVLKNNPLRARYKDSSIYVSEVRRKFPKITKLDGEALEPQILFDVNETSALPTAKASYLSDPAGADIVRQFLEQYFMIFDSDNRQPLLDAYHEQAQLSLSVPPASQAGRLNNFWKFNRNFRRIMNNEEANKIRQLKVGRLSVVSTLAEWPKTEHHRETLTVDLTIFTPQMLCFSVGGLFKEFDCSASSSSSSTSSANHYELRYFMRNFVIVPHGGGYCIRNETILVTGATHKQLREFKRAQHKPAPGANAPVTIDLGSGRSQSLQNRLQPLQPQSVAIPLQMIQEQIAAGSSASGSITATTPQPNEATKMQMVQAMSTQSHMNLDWSRKCLEETNWDFNHAAFVFDKLHKEHKIPPEAFIK